MYKESSSSQSSTPRKSTTLVEKVDVHQMEKHTTPTSQSSRISTARNKTELASDNVFQANHPIPLPRKKIFVNSSNENSNKSANNNSDLVISLTKKETIDNLSKKSKEEQNKNTKMKEIPNLQSNDSQSLSSSDSGAATPLPSKRREFYFAENRNDTIVTNANRNSIFSIDEEEIDVSSSSSKRNRKIPFTSSHIEYINEKKIVKMDSRRASTTTSQSPIDSDLSQCDNPKTIVPDVTSSDIKNIKSVIPPTSILSQPQPPPQLIKRQNSKFNRRKSKTKATVLLTSSSSSSSSSSNHSDNNETDTVVSSCETELESNEPTSKPIALLATKKTRLKKIQKKDVRRKSKSEHLYHRKSGVDGDEWEGIDSEHQHRVVDGKKKSRDKRNRRTSSRIMTYSYEKIIGIFIHQTSELLYDTRMTSVRLRISFCDMETKNYLKKSSESRNVVNYGEPEILDYIQPVISKGGRFFNSSSYIAQWEELIVLNEDIQHLKNDKVVIFFELINLIPATTTNINKLISHNGWHHICWAFLRVYPQNTFSNLDTKLKLQLFKYQKLKSKTNEHVSILEQMLHVPKRKKYPGTLEVTIQGMKPIQYDRKKKSLRSENALQEERTATFIDSEDIIQEDTTKTHNFLSSSDTLLNISHQWRKLPGQMFKVPSKLMKKINEFKSGSMVAKFNNCGNLLAYTTTKEYRNIDINILKFPSCSNILTLRGHSNHVYDINWDVMQSNVHQNLVTASSDRTAIFWTISACKYTFKILPHPSFVYCATFLYPKQIKNTRFIATGGRDGVLRIWRLKFDDQNVSDVMRSECNNDVNENVDEDDVLFQLMCELNSDNGFITGIICHKNGENIYTSDSEGNVLEWNIKLTKTRMNGLISRTFSVEPKSCISSIILHPRGRKILLNVNSIGNGMNSLKFLDIESFQIIKSLPEKHVEYPQSFAISPCGTYLYISLDNISIEVQNMLTPSDSNENLIQGAFRNHSKNYVSNIDFHPKDSYLCCCVYGPNGGVSIYEHASLPIPEYSTHKPLPSISSWENRKKLRDIIQRIDDVFLYPRLEQSQSSFEKVVQEVQNVSNSKVRERVVEDIVQEIPSLSFDEASELSRHESTQEPLTVKEASQLEIKEQHVTSSNSSSSSDNECRTFSIHKSMEKSEKEKSESEKLNRTFSIEENIVTINGNTYELERNRLSDDATSVSDAFE